MKLFKDTFIVIGILIFINPFCFSQDREGFTFFWNPDGSPVGNAYRLDSIADLSNTIIDSTIFAEWDTYYFEKDTTTTMQFSYAHPDAPCSVSRQIKFCPTCPPEGTTIDYIYENSRIAAADGLNCYYTWDDYDRLIEFNYDQLAQDTISSGYGYKRTYNEEGNLELSESSNFYPGGNIETNVEYFYDERCLLVMKKSTTVYDEINPVNSDRILWEEYLYDSEDRLIEKNNRTELQIEMDSVAVTISKQTYEYTDDSILNKNFWLNNGVWEQNSQVLRIFSPQNDGQLSEYIQYGLEDSTWVERYVNTYEYNASKLVKTITSQSFDSGNLIRESYTNYEYNEGDLIVKFETFSADINNDVFIYNGLYYHYSPKSSWDLDEDCPEYVREEFIPADNCEEGIINNTEEIITNDMSIFPNPTNNAFTLELNEDLGFNSNQIVANIYSMIGEKVASFKMPTDAQQYSFGESLRPGNYVIQLSDGKSIKTKIIQKF